MATKRKTKKKPAGAKKSEARKPLKGAPKRLAPKKTGPNKPVEKKKAPAITGKSVPAKAAPKEKAPAKSPSTKARTGSLKALGRTRRINDQPLDSLESSPDVSGTESGDLEGLSNVESADSESVDELLEEGNAFEAGVVSGVEDSRDHAGQEVRTREVPEDDVPREYLDEQ
jgi:hypothetical protein